MTYDNRRTISEQLADEQAETRHGAPDNSIEIQDDDEAFWRQADAAAKLAAAKARTLACQKGNAAMASALAPLNELAHDALEAETRTFIKAYTAVFDKTQQQFLARTFCERLCDWSGFWLENTRQNQVKHRQDAVAAKTDAETSHIEITANRKAWFVRKANELQHQHDLLTTLHSANTTVLSVEHGVEWKPRAKGSSPLPAVTATDAEFENLTK